MLLLLKYILLLHFTWLTYVTRSVLSEIKFVSVQFQLSTITHITTTEDGELPPEGERSIANVSRKIQMGEVELDDNKNVSLVKISVLEG